MIRPVRLLGHVRVSQASDAVTIRGLTAPVAGELVCAVARASVDCRSTAIVRDAARAAEIIASNGGFTVTREVSL